LKMLGHDVFYVEDTVQYSRFQTAGKSWDDASDSVAYLRNTMEQFGFRDRWAYRDVASGKCFGMSLEKVHEICRTADVFINISASTFLREEYLSIPIRVLIDSDPMFTQIEYYHDTHVRKLTDEYKMKFIVENHTHLFTFGENIGSPDCLVPTFGFHWIPTRQPICLDFWDPSRPMPPQPLFTTVMNWSVKADLIYDQTTWGQKNTEFEKFKHIPGYARDISFKLMMTGATGEKVKELHEFGWMISDPLLHVTDSESYRSFIYNSTAEFSVAKNTYVKSNSGWFSCRSACYLAAGRPVVVQDTGFSKVFPVGEGVLPFSTPEESASALEKLESDYSFHARRAREFADAYFDSDKVLSSLIERIS